VLSDGERIDHGAGWWSLRRCWEGTEEVRLSLEREPRLVPAPDGSAWAWIQYGPTVRAEEIPDDGLEYRAGGARTAHIASGTLRLLADAPVLLAGGLDAVPGELGELCVVATDGERVRLKPLHRIHDSRYRLSWPVAQDGSQVGAVRDALVAQDMASTALEARVVDGITFGEQQPELDHEVRVQHAERGLTVDGTRWLRPQGPLSLTLRDWTMIGRSLRIEWVPGEEEEPYLLSGGDHGTAVEITAGAAGVWEMPFGTGGELEARVLLAPREGHPMPRLSRLLLLTDAADAI